MNRAAEACPQPTDFEPMCFQVNPVVAFIHARSVCRQIGLPEEAIHIAVGAVVPNAEEPEKILYGLRNPDYHTEYKNTWGLPSIGMQVSEFLMAQGNRTVYENVLSVLSARKLSGTPVGFDRTVAWTGRVRLRTVDPQFTSDYYLIMVDVKTKPVSPSEIPAATGAYAEFRWLTPDEHAALITEVPNHACGACSDLASLVYRLGRL